MRVQKLAMQTYKTAQQAIHVRAAEASWKKSRPAFIACPQAASIALHGASAAGAGGESLIAFWGVLLVADVAVSGAVF